jgi:hypothetical protein
VEKARLAGVIDGEGSIFISKVIEARIFRGGFFYKAFLSVSNPNEDFVRRIRVVGMGFAGSPQREAMIGRTNGVQGFPRHSLT